MPIESSSTDANYPAAKPFTGEAINANVVSLTGHGFSHQQPVTYRSPPAASFGAPGVDDAADTIDLGNSHGFVTGDEVIYSTDGVVIGGLDHGARYFVIVTGSGLIQLAASYEEAVGVPGDDQAEPPDRQRSPSLRWRSRRPPWRPIRTTSTACAKWRISRSAA